MPTLREDLTTALEGGMPERTPYSFYSWMANRETEKGKAAWQDVIDRGLALCHHCSTVRHIEHGVTDETHEETRDSDTYTIRTKSCPAGTLRMVRKNGWHHEDWIKTPEDYTVRKWMIENTELVTQYDEYHKAADFVGDNGVVVVTGSRTPAMSINVDWAGTERFCQDVALEVAEMGTLYEAQKKLFLEETRLLAAGPGQFVKWFENLTIAMIGPARYRDLLVSVYNDAVPALEASGKRVMVHYDGALRVIADQIATAPFHIVESLTEPPEGDMDYQECREAWPDKVLWANINVDTYHRPDEEIKETVRGMRERAGKRGLAFELSEDLPAGWEHTIPVVLETLEELG